MYSFYRIYEITDRGAKQHLSWSVKFDPLALFTTYRESSLQDFGVIEA